MTEQNRLQYGKGKINSINNDLVDINGVMFHVAGKKARDTLKTMVVGQEIKFGYDPASPMDILWIGTGDVKSTPATTPIIVVPPAIGQTSLSPPAVPKVEIPPNTIFKGTGSEGLQSETKMEKPSAPEKPATIPEPAPGAATTDDNLPIPNAVTVTDNPSTNTLQIYLKCLEIGALGPGDYRNSTDRPKAVLAAADEYYLHVLRKFNLV